MRRMRDAVYYREKAELFRKLATESDERTAADLIRLAEEYEAEVRRLQPDAEPPQLLA